MGTSVTSQMLKIVGSLILESRVISFIHFVSVDLVLGMLGVLLLVNAIIFIVTSGVIIISC